MNSVLLVNPNRMRPPIAPLALDYLGEALRRSGFDVDVLDLCLTEDPAAVIDRYFASGDPLLVAVTIRNTDDVYYVSQDFCLEKYREIISHVCRVSDAPVVLGGCGYSIFPEAILDYFDLNLGVWGEGEIALPALARQIATHGDLSEVPGLVYSAKRSGGFCRNPPVPVDLSRSGPLPRDTVDNERYFREGGQLGVETKRGCPNRCAYCADPLGKAGLSLRPPAAVAAEIAGLADRGIDHLHFCDSEFNLPAAHAAGVCSEIINLGQGDRVRWYAYCSPAPFTDELAALCATAGCAGLNFGADSGSDAMLRQLGRDFTREDLARTAETCRRHGIVFMYDLLLGGPGETRDSLKETVDLMKRLSPDRVGVSLGVRLFPGTRLGDRALAEGPLAANPGVRGKVSANSKLLAPVFYLSPELGWDAEAYLAGLIGADERFFFASREAGEANYNYNDNSVLVQAIKDGYRGAYWDILRRLKEGSGGS
ncbi:MAG: radical SAM protein [Chloroflexi bacterium]|nr:radical SAM protein [Chloroflexota bacterium]